MMHPEGSHSILVILELAVTTCNLSGRRRLGPRQAGRQERWSGAKVRLAG